MKDNKTDKIFRDKLQNFQKSPRPDAWSKINEQLHKDKKTATFLWWHKAAIILVLCLSGFLIFYKMSNHNRNQPNNLTDLKSDQSENLGINPTTNIAEKRSSSTEPNTSNLNADPIQEETPVTIEPATYQYIAKAAKSKAPKPEINISTVHKNLYEEAAMPENEIGNQPTIANASLEEGKKIIVNNKSTPPITIEFKSGKKAAKETLLADTEPEKTKGSPAFNFKKLLSKVKEGEIGLADIRQAKDDLFAFDTFKETSKRTNK